LSKAAPQEVIIPDTEVLKNYIHIKGARSNNLKNIDLFLPKNKLIAVVGLSGSGKSSLIIDTLYAEGQRRYVESLSSYARQFLDRMKKPEVDYIKGICPAIAIEQKVSTSNARSTVGSLTEIYDYLRLLFARIGRTYNPVDGKEVKKDSVTDVVDYTLGLQQGSRILILAPFQKRHERTIRQELDILTQKGYTRIYVDGGIKNIEDYLAESKITDQKIQKLKDGGILVDRISVNDDEENRKRMADSVLTAFNESEGDCVIQVLDGSRKAFSNRFEVDGVTFLEPSPQLFNYNNPFGACPKCEGYGRTIGIDPLKVIPDPTLSVYQGAIACWKGEHGQEWLAKLINNAEKFDFPIHRSIHQLTEQQYELLWTGNQYFWGINDYFSDLEDKLYKIQNRVMLARYRGRTVCPTCKGGRLRKEATYIKIDKVDIGSLINIPIGEVYDWITKAKITDYQRQVSDRIIKEIEARLSTMIDIGLAYLSLDRLSATLSGGETQRINLTRTLGSNLSNSMYILDEPSVGLHPKDTAKLVQVLKNLRNLGNTVIVVEHEEEVIKNADFIIEIGPKAGVGGGDLVFAGTLEAFKNSKSTLTAEYLTGVRKIPLPPFRRKPHNKISLKGAFQHNLKGVDITVPLNAFTCVSGVSGSGKTTLIKSILYPALLKHFGEVAVDNSGLYKELSGDLSTIKGVELINQAPIGKSSRSNPVTYVKAYDAIRKLFASQQLSKVRGYEQKHFSFNVEGGRCETCKGEGVITVEMQFLADVNLICDECQGKRFKRDVLEVTFDGHSINDVLELTVDQALEVFKSKKEVSTKLQPLQDVGLGYVHLGQASSTLSGGEAQRVKLASFLSKEFNDKNILFIFDEPTTGLHYHDINTLMDAFNALIENGHTVICIEHNIDVIKTADWLIDLGPDGGKNGGQIMYQGVPEGILDTQSSTGEFLREKLS
jgi:excinuclease ABC subunit A